MLFQGRRFEGAGRRPDVHCITRQTPKTLLLPLITNTDDSPPTAMTQPDTNSPVPTTEPAQASSDPSHTETPVASEDQLRRLEGARGLLLRVHRALLEVERTRYEKVRGRIANNSAFLQLVIADPWFDWLRPMAQLVLLIDERTSDKKTPLGAAEAKALFDRARSLLRADSEGDAFQRLYYQAVQSSPDLAVITRQVASGLGD